MNFKKNIDDIENRMSLRLAPTKDYSLERKNDNEIHEKNSKRDKRIIDFVTLIPTGIKNKNSKLKKLFKLIKG